MITAQDQQQWGYLLDPCFQLVNTAGKPVTNGFIEVYYTGTRTKYYCASDFNRTLHPFQIPLDSLGSNIVLADPANSYDIYVYNAFGSLIMSRYNVTPGKGGGSSGGLPSQHEAEHWLGQYGATQPLVGNEAGQTLALPSKPDYQGDFIDHISYGHINADEVNQYPKYMYLKPGLYLVNCVIRFRQQPGTEVNRLDELLVYTGNGNANEDVAWIQDETGPNTSGDRHCLKLTFIRKVLDEGVTSNVDCSDILYFAPGPSVNWSEAYIQTLQIVKLNSISNEGGQSYIPGDYISIVGNVISVTGVLPESATGDFVTYDEYNTEIQNIHNEIDNLEITVQNAEKVSIDLDFGNTIQTVNTISTDGSTVRTDGFNFTLPTIKAGDGIEFTKVGTETTISMDSEVGDVVETVEKLKTDLDTQITTNFDMPNISQVYDFADGNNWITHNGACMLYQSFTIPINHEVRTLTDDPNTPTLLGVYMKNTVFDKKVMLALYEYTYAGEGEEHGSSTYVGDTGPVSIVQGMNEFPLKNRNPSITELRSDKVYYASLYLPSDAFKNGLMLAGCPSYGGVDIPAEPRLTCVSENITWNNQELDMSDPTTTLNHYTSYQQPDGSTYYQYDIGPWWGQYNERSSAPRFYMQIRNGEFNEPVIPTAPFEDLGNSKLPDQFDRVSNLPVSSGWTWSTDNCSYVDVTPATNVSITEYEYIDDLANAPNYVSQHCVYNSDYSTHFGGTATVTNLGQAISITQSGTTVIGYRHKVQFSSPIALTANTTYRFLAECFNSSSSHIFGWSTPTNVVDSCNNGNYVNYSQSIIRYPNYIGKYLKLTDSNSNSYVI